MDEELIYYGDAIKATQLDGGGVKLGGYLVRFGSPSETDLTGDYFTKDTDFGDAKQADTWFNHRQPVKLKKHNVQVQYKGRLPKAELTKDDIGIFAEVVIEARNEYEKTIAELGLAGKLAWSSGTAGHLVDRKNIKTGVFEITDWPLGSDASLTPYPAEYRKSNQIMQMKSLIPSEDSALSDADDNKTTPTINNKSREIEMDELEIKAMTEKAVADALALRDAETKAVAERQAELKAAADAAYKQALEDVKSRKAPVYHSTDPVDDDNDGVGAFKSWMQTGQENGGLIRPDASFNKIPEAKAAWNVTTGASGAFLVPDPLYNQIIAKRDLGSWVRQVPVQYFQTPADHILVPREDTKLTDFVLTAEAAAYDENEGTVSQKDLILYKYTKMTKVNEEFLMYNSTNWESWFANAMGRAVAGTENTMYTTGTGTGQPEGIVTGATVANTTATTDVILPAELTTFFGYLGGGYNVSGEVALLMANVTKWYMRGQTGNPFLFNPTPALNGDNLFGFPVVINDDLEPYTTASAKCIVFGNFNYYGVVEKPGMVVQRNPYLYMANGQIGIFASIFRGGGVLQAEAFYYLTNHS
jgi:HK97 family phage major capsid protein